MAGKMDMEAAPPQAKAPAFGKRPMLKSKGMKFGASAGKLSKSGATDRSESLARLRGKGAV